MKAEGWPGMGGGRNIVRVDVTGDGGKSWATAEVDGRKSTTIWSFLGVGILECDVLPWLPRWNRPACPKLLTWPSTRSLRARITAGMFEDLETTQVQANSEGV
jgi:hypothetical protein